MRPSGVIYQSSRKNISSGELRIFLTDKERKRFKLIRFIGANISSFALAFVIFFYGPTFELDLDYQAGMAKVSGKVNYEENTLNSNSDLPSGVDGFLNDNPNQFSISIPSIGATANVVSGVDPFDEQSYKEALKEGVAHAVNSGYPGGGGLIYLFAHSTNSPANFAQYNAVFYQLRLLSKGDRIFVNYNGDTYLYFVKEKVVANAKDTHWLTGKPQTEQLVLQTCDPPGTTLRRLLVVAEPAN